MKYLSKEATEWLKAMTEEPWRKHLVKLDGRGDLIKIGDIYIDAANMFSRKFICDTSLCSPGPRKRGRESCCMELTASITEKEKAALKNFHEEIKAFMSLRDRGWSRISHEDCFELGEDNDIEMKKRHKRCIFSYLDSQGRILCSIESIARKKKMNVLDIKPITCLLFPMLLVDLNDNFLITVLDEENYEVAGFSEEIKKYECIRENQGKTPFYKSMKRTITVLFGDEFYSMLEIEARTYLNRKKRAR